MSTGQPPPREVRFKVVLPLPPSVNDWMVPMVRRIPDSPGAEKLIRARMAVRTAKGVYAAGVTKSRAAEQWLEAARAQLAAMPRPPSLHRGVLRYRVTVYVPSLASDGPNRGKLFEDALNELVIDDDRQFVEWTGRKDIDAENPRIELEVWHADPTEHPRVSERLARAETEGMKRKAKTESSTRAPNSAPAYKTPAPAALTYGKRHGLDKLRGLARSATYPAKSSKK